MTTTALFTGDSITDMGRRTDSPGFLGAGYVRRVSELASAANVDLTIINTAVGGDRTSDLLRRWGTDVVDRRPHVLTILVGVNDMWRRYDAATPTTVEEFSANYASLIERSRNELDLQALVLMEPFLVPVRPEQYDWLEEDLADKIAAVRHLAAKYDATLIRLHDLFLARAASSGAASVIDDGVHPSAGGHELIAQEWWRTLSPRL